VIQGRLKELIKVDGLQVAPAELELLPRLPTGKVLRRLLRDRERAAAGPPLSPTRRG
jgi:hypothetical protein